MTNCPLYIWIWGLCLFLSMETLGIDTCRVRAHKAVNPPVIDGRVSDDVWQSIAWAGDFTEQFPITGATPSASTRFAVAYDRHYLYVAVVSDIGDVPLTQRMTRRDRDGEYDKIEVIVSPQNDQVSGYGFIVNPNGIKQDGIWSGDTVFDRAWDGVWEAESAVDEDDWTVEMAIPLHQLRIQEGVDSWGIQVIRWQAHSARRLVFCPWRATDAGVISRMGRLQGTASIPARMPFTVTSELYLRGVRRNTGYSGTLENGLYPGAGGTIRAGVTRQWTLDVAVLPDFGETEIDRAVVNLTQIEPLYEEKRPFFLEASKQYKTHYTLFYSRRLGQQAPVPELEDAVVVHGPSTTPILSATRLSGHGYGGGYLSLLHALTMPVRYRMQETSSGELIPHRAQPWIHNAVLRAGKWVDGRHHLGTLVTSSVPQYENTPVAIDRAHTGGLDFNLLTRDREWALRGQIVGSAVAASEMPYQTDMGMWVRAERMGGSRFLPAVRYDYRGDALELNTLGYLDRNDLHDVEYHLQYRQAKKIGMMMELYAGAKVHQQWNTEGLSLKQAGVLYLSSRWPGSFWTHIGGYGDLPFASDMEIPDGPPIHRPGGGGGWMGISTPERRAVSFRFDTNLGTDHDGYYLVLSPQWTFRSDRFELFFGNRLTRSYRRLSFVESVDDSLGETIHLAGERSLMQLDTEMRSTVVLFRELTLQWTGQLLTSAAQHNQFRKVDTGGRLLPGMVPSENPDFSRSIVRFQFLVRYEYLPGSVVYVSYSLNGEGEREKALRTFPLAFRTINRHSEQQFFIKLSHRFDL